MVGAEQETTLSVHQNHGSPTRTNQIREVWFGEQVSTEHWCTTIVSVSNGRNLYCSKHELPSSLGHFQMGIDSLGTHSGHWVFRCSVDHLLNRTCDGLSLKIFLEKYPARTDDGYITIPANHERLRLETSYAGNADFRFIDLNLCH